MLRPAHSSVQFVAATYDETLPDTQEPHAIMHTTGLNCTTATLYEGAIMIHSSFKTCMSSHHSLSLKSEQIMSDV